MNHVIKNFSELATTYLRRDALEIVEAGYLAIDTPTVLRSKVKVENNELCIDGKCFKLSDFKRIRIIGFGKASCKAVLTLEEVLGNKLSDGITIDVETGTCEVVEMFTGTHPRPSIQNVVVGGKIIEMAEGSNESDLVIVVASGGGSALLCYPESECLQGTKLYEDFLDEGGTISELNTLRKHLSLLKGGGLAKILYPATVIGLVFNDVPGGTGENVASGPTYPDNSTLDDVRAIIEKYGMRDHYDFNETPKDPEIFKKVHNFMIVSNDKALAGMTDRAEELGYRVKIIGNAVYDDARSVPVLLREGLSSGCVNIAGGEPSLVVTKKGGKGGRNQYVALSALASAVKPPTVGGLTADEVLISFASDGWDNCDSAGGIADMSTLEKAKELGIVVDILKHLNDFSTYDFFEKTNSNIMTGRTGSNVSDLMFVIKAKKQ